MNLRRNHRQVFLKKCPISLYKKMEFSIKDFYSKCDQIRR